MTSRPPSSATARRRWSVSETPVPPVVITTSAGSAAGSGTSGGEVLQACQPLSIGVADPFLAAVDAAEHFHHGRELRAEGIPDLPWDGQAVGHNFGAGQQELDHRLPPDQQVIVPGQGRDRQMGRVQGYAGLDQDFPRSRFLAGLPDVLAVPGLAGAGRAAGHQQRQAVVVRAQHGTFAAQHRFGAGRDQSAGDNGAGLVGCQPLAGFRHDPRTAAVDGPAVHRGRRIVRHVVQRGDVFGQDPAQGLVKGNPARRNRRGDVKGGLARLVPGVGKVFACLSAGGDGCGRGFRVRRRGRRSLDGGHSTGVPADSAS